MPESFGQIFREPKEWYLATEGKGFASVHDQDCKGFVDDECVVHGHPFEGSCHLQSAVPTAQYFSAENSFQVYSVRRGHSMDFSQDSDDVCCAVCKKLSRTDYTAVAWY